MCIRDRSKALAILLFPAFSLEYIHWFTDYYFTWKDTATIARILAVIVVILGIDLFISNKKTRTAFLITSTVLILLSVRVLTALGIISGAYGTKSRVKGHWKINQYEIRHIGAQGWAGPSYTSYTLRRYALKGLFINILLMALWLKTIAT